MARMGGDYKMVEKGWKPLKDYEGLVKTYEGNEINEKSKTILAEDKTIESKLLWNELPKVYPFAIDSMKCKIERELMTVGILSFLVSKNYNDLFDLLTKQENFPTVKVEEWIANHNKEMREVVKDMSRIIVYEIHERRDHLREIEELSEEPYRGHSHWSMPGM